VLDLEDDISELSSLSCYPNSPGTSAQILLDDRSGISHVNLGDEDDEGSRFIIITQSFSGSYPAPIAKAKTGDTALFGMGQTGGATWAIGRNPSLKY